jgi:hypothetical protein
MYASYATTGELTMKKTNEFKTEPRLIIPTVRAKPIAAEEPNIKALAIKALISATVQGVSKRTLSLICLVCGIGLGLYYGWIIAPVEWTNITYQNLQPEDKALLLDLATDLSVYDANNAALVQLQNRWSEVDELACYVVASGQVSSEDEIKLTYLAYRINQKGCE